MLPDKGGCAESYELGNLGADATYDDCMYNEMEKLMEADTEDTDGIFRIMDEQFKDSVTQDINSYKKLSI